jgi:hypothetical protein
MKKLPIILLIIFIAGVCNNASSQGFLAKMQKLKDKVNSWDNKYRETWLPFPDENYHIKTITCAYGNNNVYKIVYTYNDNELLQNISIYTINPKSGKEKFFRSLKDIEYFSKDSIVSVRSCVGMQDNKPLYRYNAYKMKYGKIIASAGSDTPFTSPIAFSVQTTYNDKGKIASCSEYNNTLKYNDQNQLIENSFFFNGRFTKYTYTYDEKNPLIFACKSEIGATKDSPLKTNSQCFKIVKKDKNTESVIREAFENFPEKEEVIVTRDYAGKIVKVTDNTFDRLLNATIEYEERASNDKLFSFTSDFKNFVQFGNCAIQYKIPFFLFYYDED